MAKRAPLDLVLSTRRSLHDLAQPLAALTGLVDLLLLETAADDPRLQDLQRMSEQLEKVLEIVSEIRRMLREASGAEPLRQAPAAHPELYRRWLAPDRPGPASPARRQKNPAAGHFPGHHTSNN